MPPVIKMSYEDMENMAKAFEGAAQRLDEVNAAMARIVGLLNEGALQGQPGTALENAIDQTLSPKIKQLSGKMGEMEGDIRGAEGDLQRADESGSKGF